MIAPRRILAALSVPLALTVATLAAPAAPAHADVLPECTMTRCADARTAEDGWTRLDWPTRADWYAWPFGQDNYTGGVFQNREGQLPDGGEYHEYDVYPREEGGQRDAYRIVVDLDTGAAYFTPDHYENFYRL